MVELRYNKKRIFLVLLVVIGIIFLAIISRIDTKKDNNKKEKLDKVSNIKKIKEENLNRYTYKDGFYYEDLSSKKKEYITGKTYPSSFDERYTKIEYTDLRYLKMKYFDFDGKEHKDGEMIVHKDVAKEVLEIFYELYENKYPIHKMRLVEEYNADDELSMEDNNTSAFNYRLVENSIRLSWHCFGLAIDINPLYNPYITGDELYPKNAGEYVDRDKDFPGKIDFDDLAYKVFTKYGWKWGGTFYGEKDYQHFYKEILDSSIRERR